MFTIKSQVVDAVDFKGFDLKYCVLLSVQYAWPLSVALPRPYLQTASCQELEMGKPGKWGYLMFIPTDIRARLEVAVK